MTKLETILDEMGGVGEPWELFEPYLYYDKLGDSCWKCEIRSNCLIMWYGEGDTPLEAAQNCYKNAHPNTPKDQSKE